MTLEKIKEELDKGMPLMTYIKKNYGFSSVDAFEDYIQKLKEKANKFDELKNKE